MTRHGSRDTIHPRHTWATRPAAPPPPRQVRLTNARALRLHTLGPVTVRSATDPATTSRISQPRLVGLLCYLALARPRGLHARDTLIALLWPEADETQGRKALRNALHSLRQQLGDGAICTAGDQLVGLDSALISCDAHDLERGTWSPDESLQAHDVEPMQGFHVRGAADFDRWLSGERDRLRTLLQRRTGTASMQAPAATQQPRAQSPDAWVLHARGHYLFLRTAHGGPAEELLRSRDYFQQALDVDPAFAPAVAGLSNFYAVAARRRVLTPFHDVFGEAIRLSERTLALDETIATPHVHFGVKALYLDGNLVRAEYEFREAVRKDPTVAEGHRFLGVLLGLLGRHIEALQAMETAAALEPDIALYLSSLAAARQVVGDLAGAEHALRRTLLLEPRHGAARDRLLQLLESTGQLAEAVSERERHPAMPDAAAFRAALDEGEPAYRQLAHDAMQREAELLLARIGTPDPERVDDLFMPPVIRLVQLYARMGDFKRVRSWRLQAQASRPVLSHWFDALPEIQTAPA